MSNHQAPTGRLTTQQRRALEVKNQSVALGSGAGCGKTTVLTERFLEEIGGTQRRALGAIVALTFTEKAARELRQRIRARCREEMAGGEDVHRWSVVIRALEAAPIGTFHEFCARLLRAHAFEAGIDPEFAILDGAVAASLRDQAIRKALRRLIADHHPDLIELAVDHGLGQIRAALNTLLSSRSAGDLRALAVLEPDDLVNRWSTVWNERGRAAVVRPLSPLARCCRDLLAVITAGHPKLQGRRADLLPRLADLETGCASDQLLAEIRELAKVNDLGAKGVWPDAQTKEAVKCVFGALRSKIDQVHGRLSEDPAQTALSAANSLRLMRLERIVWDEYEQIKRRRRGLDFDDLLTMTSALLDGTSGPNRPVLAAQDAIEFVMVDEFQDTDRIQSEILSLLGGDDLFMARMFVVGDPKQSIYRFRGAEPAIFGRWRGEFPPAGRLTLSENFRSVPGVIHFVNALFAGCFEEVDPEGRANSEPNRLDAVRPDETSQSAVTLHWALPEPPGESESKVKTQAEDRRKHEARSLARWLRGRLDAGWMIVDRQTRQRRPAHGGDVAFLFRSMTDVWPFELALAELDFDYLTIGGSAFFAQQEVRDVVNVLSVVEDPLDEVALASALRSPFFSLSDDGLFWLARRFPGGLTEGLARAGEIVQLTEGDHGAAIRARDLLKRWRNIKDHVSLSDLVAAVLADSGFEAALVCESRGSRKLANTRKLVSLARNFDRQESFTLADLVARLRSDLDDPPPEEQAFTTDEESQSVRLMSIHQAKGLEFPIVVIPDLNRKPNALDPLLGLHPELGLVIRPVRSFPQAGPQADSGRGESLGWLAFQAIEKDEDRQEALRLFYVATTRARDHLVISAGLETDPDPGDLVATCLAGLGSCCAVNPGNPRPASPAFELLIERFDWRTGRCLRKLPDGWPQPHVETVLTTPGEHQYRRRRVDEGPRLEAIRQAIVNAPPAQARHVRRPRALPRLIDLDPQAELPGRSDRLGRLIRETFVEPSLLRGEPLDQVCERVGRRQTPGASSTLIDLAVRSLESWPQSPLFEELRVASLARQAIEHGLRWNLSEVLESEKACVIQGSCDAVYRDRQRRWRPVIASTDPSRYQADRLRLLFSELAIARCGLRPAGPAWWICFKDEGQFDVDIHMRLSPSAIEQAVVLWLAQGGTVRRDL
jgi:ATP-dependent helicase/nuclease subunit A